MSAPSVRDFGQSLWLDYMRRQLLTSGEFERLVDAAEICGVTSNPTIFEQAIGGSNDYDERLQALERERDRTAGELYEQLAIEDIRAAADTLRPVYEQSAQADGYACLEVSPRLAHDTRATVAEATRLWQRLDRPNVMIKVPATPEGTLAIEQLLAQGINVNVTLMFAQRVYERVVEAYLSGLSAFAARGGNLRGLASVASIFVSRFDVMVDPLLRQAAHGAAPDRRAAILGLQGKVGIANAKRMYRDFERVCASSRFQELAQRGARPQRILFASTSTKDARRSDVMYVEALIGPDTVDTVPPATLDAFRDHGRAQSTLLEDLPAAERVLTGLAQAGISLDAITDRLLDEGLAKFSASFDQLMATLEQRRRGLLGPLLDRSEFELPAPLQVAVQSTLEDWRDKGKLHRLWARDASLWTSHDEARWLDWLQIADAELDDAEPLVEFAAELRARGLTHVAVLGMGGSSLAPDVLGRVFAAQMREVQLDVLDSTDPAQVRAFEESLDLERTLFVVSSKSGSTLEPNLLADYFFDRLALRIGQRAAASNFVVVTDPDSALQAQAHERGYARVFFGAPGVGGRYSALSHFGMLPAAAAGLDVRELLGRSLRMVHACASCVPPEANPGVLLGALLGVAQRHGRDKVTLVASPPIAALGAWLEQLLAESTGKRGTGLIPVDGELLGPPEVYGSDRLFVYLRLDDAADPAQDAALDRLAKAGQPVARIAIRDARDLGQEFFRWELATAVTGSILGVNPFDQPDVEASKQQARELMRAYEASGRVQPDTYFFERTPIGLFADPANLRAIEQRRAERASVGSYLRAHLERAHPGDYLCLLGWFARNQAHAEHLQALRQLLRDRLHLATCVGFGPRFLHSTGQAYKGGPASGVFVHLVADDVDDLHVPGKSYSFGVVKHAQARGDLRVLQARERRVLGVHLGKDARAGMELLTQALIEVLP